LSLTDRICGTENGSKRHAQIEAPVVRKYVIGDERGQRRTGKNHGEGKVKALPKGDLKEMHVEAGRIFKDESGQKGKQQHFAVNIDPELYERLVEKIGRIQ
jgi:hypothetical protein